MFEEMFDCFINSKQGASSTSCSLLILFSLVAVFRELRHRRLLSSSDKEP